jgi:hypothetical protein
MSINPLTNQQLKEQAPALFTNEPHFEVSKKYHFIPTIDVIEEIKSYNWYPVIVSEANVRDISKDGYQQHMVRFRHLDDLLNPLDNAVELLLFNSHDRSKAFSISAGIYRYVCANGLVLANNQFESIKIRHIGDRENDIQRAIMQITSVRENLKDTITRLESIDLSLSEKESFAKSAIPLRFEEHLQIDYSDLLHPHRDEDNADDLYTTLNVIQENLIRGGVSGVNKNTGRNFTSKAITSISNDVSINQNLWSMAERIASIKEPELLAA